MALKTPPAPGSYRYVLRTIREYEPTIPRTASTYMESVESRDITHPDAIRRPTIFLSVETSRDFLVKKGWEDVSAQWFAEYGPEGPREDEPVAPTPPAPEQGVQRRRVAIRA